MWAVLPVRTGVGYDGSDASCMESHLISKREFAPLIEEEVDAACDEEGAIVNGFPVCELT